MAARLAPLALALCLAACGSGEEGEVRGAVNRLYDGFADRDAKRVCESITEERRREIAGRMSTCSQAMGIAMGLVGEKLTEVGDAEVEKVEVDGRRATATVRSDGRSSRLGLSREGGEWKVADFALDQL